MNNRRTHVHLLKDPLKLFSWLTLISFAIYWIYSIQTFKQPINHTFHELHFKQFNKFNFEELVKNRSKLSFECPVVSVDINDPIVKEYKKNVVFSCPKTKPLTELSQKTGLLTLSLEAKSSEKLTCYYSFMWRAYELDNYIDYR